MVSASATTSSGLLASKKRPYIPFTCTLRRLKHQPHSTLTITTTSTDMPLQPTVQSFFKRISSTEYELQRKEDAAKINEARLQVSISNQLSRDIQKEKRRQQNREAQRRTRDKRKATTPRINTLSTLQPPLDLGLGALDIAEITNRPGKRVGKYRKQPRKNKNWLTSSYSYPDYLSIALSPDL